MEKDQVTQDLQVYVQGLTVQSEELQKKNEELTTIAKDMETQLRAIEKNIESIRGQDIEEQYFIQNNKNNEIAFRIKYTGNKIEALKEELKEKTQILIAEKGIFFENQKFIRKLEADLNDSLVKLAQNQRLLDKIQRIIAEGILNQKKFRIELQRSALKKLKTKVLEVRKTHELDTKILEGLAEIKHAKIKKLEELSNKIFELNQVQPSEPLPNKILQKLPEPAPLKVPVSSPLFFRLPQDKQLQTAHHDLLKTKAQLSEYKLKLKSLVSSPLLHTSHYQLYLLLSSTFISFLILTVTSWLIF